MALADSSLSDLGASLFWLGFHKSVARKVEAQYGNNAMVLREFDKCAQEYFKQCLFNLPPRPTWPWNDQKIFLEEIFVEEWVNKFICTREAVGDELFGHYGLDNWYAMFVEGMTRPGEE